MAYQEQKTSISLPANADLSSNQYHFVTTTNSSGQARVALAGDGAFAIGVLQNKPDTAGDVAEIAIGGVLKVVAGGSITSGAAVACDANGEAVTAASGDVILGTAIKSADAADIIPVLFQPRNTL